jgi:hypothetical protein
MASITIRPNRHHWIQWTASDGSRKTLPLGKSTKRVAEQHQLVVESLLANQVAGYDSHGVASDAPRTKKSQGKPVFPRETAHLWQRVRAFEGGYHDQLCG